MTPETVLELGQMAVKTTLMIAAPMLGAGMIVGLIISIFQAATHINEMTMTFVPKIVAVFVAMIVAMPWIMSKMTNFAVQIFETIAAM